MDGEDTRRRFKAALAIGGFERVDALAQALDLPGLKRDTLYAIQSGSRAARPQELRVIAEACGLPYEFFTADFSSLRGATLEDRLREIEAVLDAVTSGLSLEQLDADESLVLQRWQQRNEPLNGEEAPGSQTQGEG